MRTCRHCGEPIIGRAANARYCSSLCKVHAAYDRESSARGRKPSHHVRTCGFCGVEFLTSGGNHKFCSRECVIERQKERAKEHRRRAAKAREYESCGQPFKTPRSYKRFCSVRCRSRASYLRTGRRRYCEKIAASDLPDGEKAERIQRIVGPVEVLTEDEIAARTAAIRERWNGAERQRRKIGPAPAG